MTHDHMTLNDGWQSTQAVPLPHRRLELKDEYGVVVEDWSDGVTWFFQNGGTGNKNNPIETQTFGPLERDPTGRDQHEPGAKLDHGKNRLGLVLNGFARALVEVGQVGTYGAEKYSDNGWRDVPDGIDRYTDAMYRHHLDEAAGELTDADSGLLHAAHAAWNALARLELILQQHEECPRGAVG